MTLLGSCFRFRSALAALALTAAVAVQPAHATTTTIDFNALSGANASVFTSYTESGFTVTNISGMNVATGGNGTFGNPLPDLYTDDSGSVSVTDGGSLFTFDSVQLGFYDSGTISYSLTGSLTDGTVVFGQSGTISSGTDDSFKTLTSAYSSDNIDTLTIAISSTTTGGSNIDNIVLGSSTAVTPEPSSLALLGTGALALAGLVRRRFKA